ncbi:unnamed protein product, partial [Polarella glacialis]
VQASSGESFSSIVRGLPPDRLDLPISCLLADAPPEPPPKRARLDPDQVVISKQTTEPIRLLLAQPPPNELRFMFWNIDGLDEVGGASGLAKRVL